MNIREFTETRKVAFLGIMSALATGLMFIEIPYNPWLRIDISDVVVLMVFILMGVKEGLLVALIKSVLHFISGINPTFGIGEFTAFIASAVYLYSFFFASKKLNLNTIYSSLVSIVIMTITLTTLNWLFVVPLWGALTMETRSLVDAFTDLFNNYPPLWNWEYAKFVIALYVPFNLLKGFIVFSVLFGVRKSIKF